MITKLYYLCSYGYAIKLTVSSDSCCSPASFAAILDLHSLSSKNHCHPQFHSNWLAYADSRDVLRPQDRWNIVWKIDRLVSY